MTRIWPMMCFTYIQPNATHFCSREHLKPDVRVHRGHYHRYGAIFCNQTENDKWYFGAENCSPRVNTGQNIIEIYEIWCLCRPTISTNFQLISIEIATFLQVFSSVQLCSVKGCSQTSKSLHLVPTNERFLLLGGRMAPTHCSWDKAERWQLGLYLNIRHTRAHTAPVTAHYPAFATMRGGDWQVLIHKTRQIQRERERGGEERVSPHLILSPSLHGGMTHARVMTSPFQNTVVCIRPSSDRLGPSVIKKDPSHWFE